MVRRSVSVLGLLAALFAINLLAPCPTASAAAGKRVTRVLIKKKEHTMVLLAGTDAPDKGQQQEEVVASYTVAIGPGGFGPKKREGDMVTPIGRYHLTV